MKCCRKKTLLTKRKVIIIFILAMITCYIIFLVNPLVYDECFWKTKSLINIEINEALNDVLTDDYSYDKLISITYSNDNKILGIHCNSLVINKFNNEIIKSCSKRLELMKENKIEIPLGCFSGIKLLNNLGPEITIQFKVAQIVSTNFSSTFESCGINQTIHRLYINILTELKLMLPYYQPYMKIDNQLLICENIIVGEIPQVYFSNGLNDKFNFFS